MNDLRAASFQWLLMISALSMVSACREAGSLPAGIPQGFVMIAQATHTIGSTDQERNAAVTQTCLTHEDVMRERLGLELERTEVALGAFAIGMTPVINRQYAEFIAATNHRAPTIEEDEWVDVAMHCGLGLVTLPEYHKYVRPLCWTGGKPPGGRMDEPVVLISRDDALAYCRWLSRKLERVVRLPDEIESEAAAGNTLYPWGDEWRHGSCQASSNALGPARMGSIALPGVSATASQDRTPAGVADYAGQVYEWTLSPDGQHRGYAILKGGGSWLDEGYDCRRACRRSAPEDARHALIGFRVVVE